MKFLIHPRLLAILTVLIAVWVGVLFGATAGIATLVCSINPVYFATMGYGVICPSPSVRGRRRRSGAGCGSNPALSRFSNLLATQRRIGSADFCQWQIQRQVIYDFVRLNNAGVSTLQFFNNPVGTNDPTSGEGKSLEQTNLTQPRSFGQIYFIIHQIRTFVHLLPKPRQNAGLAAAALMADAATPTMILLRNLLGMGVLRIRIGQKDYFDIAQPLRHCPPGMGVEIHRLAAARGSTSLWVQQSVNPRDVYNLTPEQLIEPEQTFEATIEFPAGTTPNFGALANPPKINVGLLFEGYVARPLQ